MSGEGYTAWVDGAARGNPGPASYGVLVEGPDGQVAAELNGRLGETTNNVAEYRALLAALEWAVERGVARLEVFTDSLLIASQVTGNWKVKDPRLRGLYLEVRGLANRLEGFRIRHIPREENAKADRLANQALAGHPKKVPEVARGGREPARREEE